MPRTLMRVASEGSHSFTVTACDSFTETACGHLVLVSAVLCLSSSRVLFCFDAF